MPAQSVELQEDIDLAEGWTVTCATRDEISVPASIPFDVHSRLYDAALIPDPYFRDNELSLDWVHEAEWIAARIFSVDATGDGHWTLTLDGVDCITSVAVNGTEVGRTENQFLRYDLDVTEALVEGENRIEIRFHSSTEAARKAKEAFPFELPYATTNCRIPWANIIRKTQCDAGWDWNIALMPLGIYGGARLRRREVARLDDVKIVQRHENGSVTLDIEASVFGHGIGETDTRIECGGQVAEGHFRILPGENRLALSVTLDNPDLWWPVGHGPQAVHELTVTVGGESVTKRLALRTVELITAPDAIGAPFTFRINGRDIFCRGANWIPADALPERSTPDVTRQLLQSAVDANMNMIRVWGGGRYEADWFYEICAELGLMVWQDFMFACNHYPAADRSWLKLVRREAHQQTRRLSAHGAVVLLCGDNELVGAIDWFEVTRNNRDRYLANYDRLNHAIEEAVAEEDIGVPFWPSSPSLGRLDFGDGWHADNSGDMHFWSVWHEAKDFEHYRTVQPRFCSEFGFQSFPSMAAIERFTEPGDRNISSPVMDIHQRNIGGNARIVETMARYFRFPDGFSDMVFLSQVQQALAIRTAVEFWRSIKPRCMGTLVWQLNDTWPVASWASLEHGGAWKLLHYASRRFNAPVLVAGVPDELTGDIMLKAVCDAPQAVTLTITPTIWRMSGANSVLDSVTIEVPADSAVEALRMPAASIPDDGFLAFSWASDDGAHTGESEYLPRRFKAYDLPDATIAVTTRDIGHGNVGLTLETDKPAFFVTVGLGGAHVYSDDGFTLLPGQPKTIVSRHLDQTQSDVPPELTVQALNGTAVMSG